MSKKQGFLLAAILLMAAVALHAALPFLMWLDAPKRANPNDPKSNLFFPTNTPAAGVTYSYDAKDPGDDVATAATVMGNVSAPLSTTNDGSHYIGSGTDSYDWYAVNYTAGQTYDIIATRSAGSVALKLDLYFGPATAPTLVASASGAPATLSNQSGSGTYYIRISVASAGTDSYTLSVNNVTGASPTDTPTYSPTITPTATPTLSNTPNNFTATWTPTISPSPTAGAHTSLVTDFENGLQTEWAPALGSIFPSVDGYGSTFNPSPFSVTETAGNGSPLSGGTITHGGCFSGTEAIQVGPPTNQYPYCVLTLELVAGGSNHVNANVNLLPFAPAKSMSFSYAASAPLTSYIVDIVTKNVADVSYFQYILVPPDTAWHSITIYFPDGAGSPKFAQPGWSTSVQPWSTEETVAGAIRFQPVPSTSGTVPYSLCVDDVTFAAPPTPTPSITPSNTPVYSPTASPTPIAGFGGVWYDGDTAGAMVGDVSFLSVSATVADQAGTANPGHALQLDFNAATGYASADVDRGGPTGQDVTPFNQLEFDIYIPSAQGCIAGRVQLLDSQTAPNDQSMPITMTTYTSPQGPIVSGQWNHIRMPLAAFNGANGQGGTFAAGYLSGIMGIRFQPINNAYSGTGTFTGRWFIDNLKFTVGTPLTVAPYPAVFCDFESGKSDSTTWGGYWSSSNDQDGPDFTCSPGTPSSRVFPANNTIPPVMADGNGDSLTSCHYGRFAGYKGGDGNGGGPGQCGVGHYSYFSMAAPFNMASAGPTLYDQDIAASIGFTPSAIRFNVKKGPNDVGGQQYFIAIVTDNTICGGCDWQAYFPVTSSWSTVTIPFPANGTNGVWPSWGTWPPVDSQFHQPPNAPAGTWGSGLYNFQHFKQFQMAASSTETQVDMEIDDIQFIP